MSEDGHTFRCEARCCRETIRVPGPWGYWAIQARAKGWHIHLAGARPSIMSADDLRAIDDAVAACRAAGLA